jgi:hypothetical protein
MSGDPTYSNIPLLITFLKSYKRAYLGDTARPDLATANGSHKELVSPDLQSKFRQLFEAYFSTASKALVKGQTVSGMNGSATVDDADPEWMLEIARARQEEL